MKLLNETQTFSFPQVFLIGIVFAVLLRLLMGLIWWSMATINPSHLYHNVQVMPWPILILGVPVLLALIIIAFSGPKWEQHKPFFKASLTATTEDAENERLFNPRFTPQQVLNIIKVMTVIWAFILITQFVGWFAFSNYVR